MGKLRALCALQTNPESNQRCLAQNKKFTMDEENVVLGATQRGAETDNNIHSGSRNENISQQHNETPRPQSNRKMNEIAWEEMAEDRWGTNPLVAGISHSLLDDLLGWAIAGTEDRKVSGNESASSSSVLGDLPDAPLMPSFLHKIHLEGTRILQQGEASSEVKSNLWERLDQSALVAMGMFLEEMMTASLLPYAVQHSKYCRSLDEASENGETSSKWVIPPSEAIHGVAQQSLVQSNSSSTVASFPVSRPPTHSSCLNEDDSQNQSSVSSEEAHKRFADSHDTSEDKFAHFLTPLYKKKRLT